ncbi:hypothetical protein AcW1_004956 [Taiwanofungus camphoratus]|nr:hypothetical protein AcW1_004956 [Antrodia cinnamomea]
MVGSTPHCKRRSSASSGDQRGPLEFMNLSLSGHQSSLESLGTKNRAGHTACRGKPQPARNGHDHGRASCSQNAAKHTHAGRVLSRSPSAWRNSSFIPYAGLVP